MLLLTRSKLIDPLACRGLKSLRTSDRTRSDLHEMLDESVDDSGDVMLDGDGLPNSDAVMEIDAAEHIGTSQEDSHFPDVVADEGEEHLDNDYFWDHGQDDFAHENT